MISREAVLADIKITFFTEIWCFFFFIFPCTMLLISTWNTCLWVSQDGVAFLTTKQILIWTLYHNVPTPLVPSVRLSGKHFPSSNYPIRKSYEKNSPRKCKMTKTSNFCKKMFMSPKTVSSNIIPIVNHKEIDYMIHLQWNSHFLVYVLFSEFFVNILPVLQFAAYTWCVGWVLAVQTIFW